MMILSMGPYEVVKKNYGTIYDIFVFKFRDVACMYVSNR